MHYMERQPTSTTFSATPFDGTARSYDADFTRTPLGRRKREIVHHYLQPLLRPEWQVLELNCGTGEDAARMSGRVGKIIATDISEGMVDVAREKIRTAGITNVDVARMGIEDLWSPENASLPFSGTDRFNLVFSNFDGMNCLHDLSPLPPALHRILEPQGQAILVMMSRFCLAETAAGLLRGDLRRAFQRRRGNGKPIHIGNNHSIRTWFHPTRTVLGLFRQHGFRIREVRAVGLTTPPTSLRDAYHRRLDLFRRLEWIEERLSPLYPFSRMGDHVLVHVERR